MPNLTAAEISDLARLEKIVEEGQQTFVEVGLALTAIRDRKLYRKDYDTFEVYCIEKWGWTHRRANQLIQAASVVQALPPDLGTRVPNEKTARELGKFHVEQQKRALTEVKSTGKPITPKSVKKALTPEEEAMEDIKGANRNGAPEKPVDAHGVPITKEAMPYWDRRSEVQELLTALKNIKSHLKKREDEGDRMFGHVFQQATANVAAAYTSITNAMPHAVCLECEGRIVLAGNKPCIHCHGTGLISKYAYDVYPYPEKKEFRLKIYGRSA